MPRPLRRYYFVFTHPIGRVIKTYATGETPCKAKNAAFDQLEKLKRVDPDLPQDNYWVLLIQTDEGIVGVR